MRRRGVVEIHGSHSACQRANDRRRSRRAATETAERGPGLSRTSRRRPPAARDAAADGSLEDYISNIERDTIIKALEESRYNKTATAKKLGITFRALRYKLKKLGID